MANPSFNETLCGIIKHWKLIAVNGEIIDYTAGKDPVPEQGSMRAIGSTGLTPSDDVPFWLLLT
jgi:hypothetical protein